MQHSDTGYTRIMITLNIPVLFLSLLRNMAYGCTFTYSALSSSRQWRNSACINMGCV